ncbi:hypothetical protein LMJ53_15825 [Rheinheimera sp. UJ51]|uniref:hypothetical protein n=1 Tax=Rheinheimera sp. UJ51 TaxID=2892446 RepID=UPI001E4BB50C|nr:hypothetical protein [Rheinheimera sp. UJ51]MCC5453188.1 hypothetical protein [Rheinheimera sp. UJ51]
MYKKALKELGIKDDEEISWFSSLLTEIDAPSSLDGIIGVLKNIRAAFDDIWMDDIHRDIALTKRIQYLLEASDSLLGIIRNNGNPKKYKRNNEKTELNELFRGSLTDYPFYPIFYLINRKNASFFKWIRHVLLMLKYLVRNKNDDTERFKDYEYNLLSVFFRRLTVDTTAITWLEMMDCRKCQNLSEFIGFLYNYRTFYKKTNNLNHISLLSPGSLSSESKSDNAIYLYHEITNCIKVLEIPLGKRKNRKQISKIKRNHANPKESINNHGVTELERDVIVQIESLANGTKDDEVYSIQQVSMSDDIDDAGEEVFEQQHEQLYVFTDHEPVEAYIAAFHGKKVAKGVIKKIERQHHYLKTENRTLSNTEVSRILNFCLSPKEGPDKLFAAFYLAMIFFSGQKEHDLSNTDVSYIDSAKSYPHVNLSKNTFVIPAFKIQYSSDSNHECSIKYSEFLHLPLPKVLSNIAEELLEGYYLSSSSLFRTSATYIDNVEKELGIKVIRSKLENHLFLRACAMFGSACATLMFNRPAPGSQARLYYTALPISVLQTRYRKLIEVISLEVGIEIPFCDTTDSNELNKTFIGCRDLPTFTQYKQLISGIQNKLADLKKRLPHSKTTKLDENSNWTLDPLMQFHNFYTAYCIVCQGLLSGIRPTHDGFINMSEILADSKVAIIRDKDSADEFHTRTLPLHQYAIKIAQMYRNHLMSILSHLHRLDLLRKWQELGCPEPFFFTASNIKNGSVKVTVSSYRPYIYIQQTSDFFKLPANSNRKILRSYFELKNINPIFIDAFLGHSNIGESQWHVFSTLSINDIRKAIEPLLDEIRKSLGIKALQGID